MKLIVILIPLFPLVGFIINGLYGKKLNEAISGLLGCITVFASFSASLIFFIRFALTDLKPIIFPIFSWISTGTINIPFNFLVDPLSALMLLIITGVGLLIHVYSTSYMHGDEAFGRYFAYLNLFIFFMTVLVLGAGFVTLFIGWEGVGLTSFLLIGFWFKNPDYNAAARKAFVMNRIGDLGFLIGIFVLFNTFGSFEFKEIFEKIHAESSLTAPPHREALMYAAFFLLIGAAGKSAQVPLYTWLPDAMAGPTPVSALIHAATMVTAGIYLVIRCNLLFSLAPSVLSLISVVGLTTALLGALIAISQYDIKKILAYSTVSQLGYLFLALGVSAFTSSFFHLLTHAFFKALLFLGAGSVIHALAGEQDVRRMGGLRKDLPVTFLCMLAGCLAISGIPPFSGFFSKDEILFSVFKKSMFMWVLALAGSGLTSFYIFRMFFLTFGSIFRGDETAKPHESPSRMTNVLIILAVFAALAGLFNLPFGPGLLSRFLAPVLGLKLNDVTESARLELILMAVSTFVSASSIYVAWRMYRNGLKTELQESQGLSGFLTRLSYNKFYVDELYEWIVGKPLEWLSKAFAFTDNTFIDGVVSGVGSGSLLTGRAAKLIQNGRTRTYLFGMVTAMILIFVWALLSIKAPIVK